MKKTVIAGLSLLLIVLCLAGCQGGKKTTTPQAPTSDEPTSIVQFSPLPTESVTPSVTETPTPTVTESATPTVTETETPQPTESETPTPTEPVTPSVTPSVPTPSTSIPEGFKVINASGTFLSDTGTKLNLSVDWKIETLEDLTYQVTLDIYLDSYSLFCSAKENGNIITIGQYELPYATTAIAYDANSGKHHTLLSSAEIIYTADTMPTELELGATWKFNGSYNKIAIETIEAKTVIDINAL